MITAIAEVLVVIIGAVTIVGSIIDLAVEPRPASKEQSEKWHARLFHRLYCWSLR